MILDMGRMTDKNLPGRVVQEPKRSLLPYVAVAVVAAFVVWSMLLPAIPDVSTLGSKFVLSKTGSEPSPGPAHADLRTLFSADDYPADAQRNGEEGTVQAQLSIDSRGRVSNCAILHSSGFESLDQATCSIFKRRARFRPAREVSGHAVPDTVVTPPVAWRLEG